MARRRNSKTTDTNKAVAYVRVSTDQQHLGPDAQLAELNRWAEANDVELVAVHSDHGVSGATELDKRPGLLAALASIEATGAGVLLVAKRDRLARDVIVGAMIERMAERLGASVVAANGAGNGAGPEALLMRRMVDAFSEYERQIIAARTRAALAVKRARGESTGHVPFGHRLSADGVHIERDETEQRVIGILRRYRAEDLTIRAVVARLNANNVATRSGRPWSRSAVSRMLNRKERAA